ncbi:MAG: cytochrome c [Burkholderiaceae bacterium]
MKVRFLLAAIAATVALPAAAQYAKPEDAVKFRQAAYTIMGNQMGRINAQLKSGKPDLAAISAAANTLTAVDHLPWDAFGAGTDMVNSSRAKPELWQQQPKFKQMSEDLVHAADKLAAAAKSGDVKAIQAAFGETGKTCKTCHDQFRRD